MFSVRTLSIRILAVVALTSVLTLLPCWHGGQIAHAQEGYFSKEATTVPVVQKGSRTSKERTVIVSLLGASVAVAALGTYYALDAKSLSDQVSASQRHTNRAWSQRRDDIHSDSERSAKIAQVTLGISSALFLGVIATYIITSPDDLVSERELQSKLQSLPSLSISREGGMLVRQTWAY
ncbi:MAG: hypothetical protein JKY56_02845 [Kofleriaceae bacterium]|nr:hypothetical protein [Kofleriaceae bacterium]